MAEIARNIVVVRRKDRRGVYYSKENFNNPHLIPGWCIVKGSGCAWVLKTLEEWKFLDTVQVQYKHLQSSNYAFQHPAIASFIIGL